LLKFSKMTSSQSLQIFEILNVHFKNAEDAKKLVYSIENVIEEKVDKQSELFEKIIHKDINILRLEMQSDTAKLEAKIAESKADALKWMIVLFAPFYIGMIVFLIKQFI